MTLESTDEEAAALLALLNRTIENDRYPLSPRIRVMRTIRAKLPGAPAEPPPVTPPRLKVLTSSIPGAFGCDRAQPRTARVDRGAEGLAAAAVVALIRLAWKYQFFGAN